MVKELSKPKESAKVEKSVETISGLPLKTVYTADDLKGWEPERDLGEPGQFPYTRGIHNNMYQGKLWTMRQFAGYGGPEETN
ncbi:MAG TPA: methylmalonyl-CoA mutase family protein, partial [Chroococcales cyanobacterium]